MTDNHESSSYSPVLAHGTDHSLSYKPKLIDFCGYEGEDFRHFRDTLESYFAIANIKDSERQASILNAQVKKYTRIFLQSKVRKNHAIGGKYTELIKLLEEEYVTPDVIEYYKDAFEQIIQGEDEPPRMFLGRIQQAADLAELVGKQGEALIEAKFKSGLLPRVKKHCYMMGATTFHDYKQFSYGFWRGQHGTTLYPQDNPFIPQKAEDRIPSTWYKNKRHADEIVQQAKTHAFHPPNLNQPSGDESPSIDILTSKMKNLELYQHEAAVPTSHYEKHPYGLEQMIRRVVQEETRKTSPSYNCPNDYHNPNYRSSYRSNHYPNSRNNYRGYNSRYPNDKNENNYQAENSYRNTENQRNKYNYNQNDEHNRPQEYERSADYQRLSDYQRRTDYQPQRTNNNNNNTPSGTLALLEENDHTKYDNNTNLPLNEFFLDDYENKGKYNNIVDEELFAAQPPSSRKNGRQLRPRNETAASQQIVHMPPLSHDQGNNNNFSVQPTFENINNNNVNISTSQSIKPTTDFQSTFGKTAFSNQATSAWNPPTRPSTPEGKQWTQLRSNVDDMEISTPPSEKETDVISLVPTQSSSTQINDQTSNIKKTQHQRNNNTLKKKGSDTKNTIPRKKNIARAIQKKPTTHLHEPKFKQPTYDIGSDILNRNAEISFGQLLKVAPSLRRQFAKACKMARSLNVLDDASNRRSPNTTALYAEFYINKTPIRCLVDSGASRTCISRQLVKRLGLDIQEPSLAIFMLGNGDRHASLGIITNLQLKPGNTEIVPISAEVLPSCPVDIIIGNNWLKIARANIDYQTRIMTINYKTNRKIPVTYECFHTNGWYDNTSPVDQIDDSESSDDRYDSDSTDNLSDEFSSTDSEEESSPLDEMLANEYYFGEELFPMSEQIDPFQIIKLNDELQVITKEELAMNPNTYHTYDIILSSVIRTSNTYIFEQANELPKHIVIYSGILHPNDSTYRISIINMSENNQAEIPSDIIVGNLIPITTNTQGYELATDKQIKTVINQYQPITREPLSKMQLDQIQVGELEPRLKQEFFALVERYQDIFDWDKKTVGCTNRIKHHVNIDKNITPISSRPYRLSPIELENLKKKLDRLLEMGVIRPCSSPWSSPILMVRKKNNEMRLVVDFRKINAHISSPSYNIPRIDDLLDSLEDSIPITNFTTPRFGSFAFTRSPMGLKCSPLLYQNLSDIVFRPLLNKCLVSYIDDLNVYSPDESQHIHDLAKVSACIRFSGLVLNPRKCVFIKPELAFLGYKVSSEGIKTNEDTIKKIANFPIPTTVTQVRSFVSLCGYYRRFIKSFAKICRPLYNQLQNDRPPWNEETTKAFETLKSALCNAPILTRANFDKEFILFTDASHDGLGAVLSQLDEQNREQVVLYISRGLTPSERNYGITKLEMLAAVWAIKSLRPYLLSRRFKLVTDHVSIKGLLDTPRPEGQIARWINLLSEYNFDVIYRPSKLNANADFLCRLGY
ncbi:hypothetical protein INT45_007797 [Circinella minor]|uniref:Reverse transcriptase domain-containing protein n=1 Tax=Circinella minor TaxID=1195481 RepID=A0A8H7RKX1_9FUNG|nr:hypothetical protein INT45_007797 [Circinella minor]